jgi:hypothetical protein
MSKGNVALPAKEDQNQVKGLPDNKSANPILKVCHKVCRVRSVRFREFTTALDTARALLVVKYLRGDKDISLTEMEVFDVSNSRYKRYLGKGVLKNLHRFYPAITTFELQDGIWVLRLTISLEELA